jgi:uncharacterized protein YrzB (UPF0473 family)
MRTGGGRFPPKREAAMSAEDDFTTLDEEGLDFTVINSEGETVEYQALFTFESEDTGKSYIAYTDNAADENGDIEVFAATYDPSTFDALVAAGTPVELAEIETDDEWELVEDLLDEYNELQEAYDGDDEEDEDEEDSE